MVGQDDDRIDHEGPFRPGRGDCVAQLVEVVGQH
jgi:hypothetical protein